MSYKLFEKIIEVNDKNFIQPSFKDDPLSYRFTCDYLIDEFSK